MQVEIHRKQRMLDPPCTLELLLHRDQGIAGLDAGAEPLHRVKKRVDFRNRTSDDTRRLRIVGFWSLPGDTVKRETRRHPLDLAFGLRSRCCITHAQAGFSPRHGIEQIHDRPQWSESEPKRPREQPKRKKDDDQHGRQRQRRQHFLALQRFRDVLEEDHVAGEVTVFVPERQGDHFETPAINAGQDLEPRLSIGFRKGGFESRHVSRKTDQPVGTLRKCRPHKIREKDRDPVADFEKRHDLRHDKVAASHRSVMHQVRSTA